MSLCQYYTIKNVFDNHVFLSWVVLNNLESEMVLEPFAGNNDIINHLQKFNIANKYNSFDIDSQNINVTYNDSFLNFPKGYNLCVTNVPFLAKNKGKSPYFNKHDDLYKEALELILKNCKYAAVILPASYLQTKLFFNRLEYLILLEDINIFTNTEHPSCLALFSNDESSDFKIYSNKKYLGLYSNLSSYFYNLKKSIYLKSLNIRLDNEKGNICIYRIDGTTSNRIKFYEASKYIKNKKYNYRTLAYFNVPYSDDSLIDFVDKLNLALDEYREFSKDIELNPYRNLRQDGKFRRRIDTLIIISIINKVYNNL